ncbi:6-bladed beta-propeller [Parapedobacter sp. 10938]|uniref:6-bladed beta-propeller n=1 Tax=Parapedobacter flavus TaxID=3110225 RepID=UPI002DB8C61B|nr:6-bladed beta-propeller [Parapedobacter sp. 10938]MEC3880618.1 6-bladed beta-propeller [Parapedobacter sp. 10938]
MKRSILQRASLRELYCLGRFRLSYMAHLLGFVAVFWLCTSCSSERSRTIYTDNGDQYVIDMAAMEPVESYKELIKEIAFIPLETNEHSLLSHIDKVVFHKGRFYIHDRRFAALKVFSEEGKYIRSIGNIGRGPGEFTTLMDFLLDTEEDKLLLLSNNEKAVMEYDLEGNYLRTMQTNVFASSFVKIGDSYHYFINQNNNDVSGLNNLIVMDENSRVLDRLFPFPEAFNVMLPDHSFLLGNVDGALFHPTLSDTVFQLTANQEIYPKYVFDFGEKALPLPMRTSYEAYNTDEVYNYSRLGNRLAETEHVISFNFLDGRSVIPSAFCNRNSVDTVQGKKVLKPLRLGFPISNRPVLGLLGEDTFITYLGAEYADYVRDRVLFNELVRENFPEFYALVPELKPGDNPVLVTFKLEFP